MSLPTLTEAQQVVYDAQYLWDVFIQDPAPPEPFNKGWFPATGLNYDLFSLNNFTFETQMGSFVIPNSSSVGNRSFAITFHDDITGSLLGWLTDWHDFMFPKNTTNSHTFVRRVSDVCGKFDFHRLGLDRSPLTTKTFFVILDGTLSYVGTNENGLSSYTQQFKIVGSY